ncbi:alpha/beta fold hydrolase [Cupriavidus basilensis]|uniref:alpha/beta fold hydrolase n=1 Tax=Cupriavidus basilensis TaxID=68895 RepID=UPI00157B0C17|nr:alpha/beta fold hydrolase [Cupriavidus basilensis]NUA31738.1 alpha/beta fold hydrolase [Cupriavidus basilensis]
MTALKGSGTGALLIHGLGGTQFDLGPMHKALRRAGVETHAVTLPGHAGTPEDLVPVRAEQWLDTVTQAYDELAGQYETFHIMGMCLGGLLALALAERRHHTKGRLIALAAPVYIDGWSTPWYRALRHLVYHIPTLPARMRVEEDEPFGIKNDLVRAIVKAKFERGDNFHYRWVPLACIRQVDRLRGWVLNGAHRIACPTLVVNAREDELTSLRSADFLEATVPDVRKVVVENSYHMICVDNDREQVVSNVLEFLGFDPAQARRPARARVEVPMTEEAVAAVVNEYLQALTSGQFEALFPLLEPGVRWRHQGEHPLAGSYDDRDAVIDMFAKLEAIAGKTVRIAITAPPRIEGATAQIDVSASSVMNGEARHSQGTQTLRMRNGRISAVTFRPADSADNALPATEPLPAPAG